MAGVAELHSTRNGFLKTRKYVKPSISENRGTASPIPMSPRPTPKPAPPTKFPTSRRDHHPRSCSQEPVISHD